MSKKKTTFPEQEKNEDGSLKPTVGDYIKGIKSEIGLLKPQVELSELKARFARANYENLRYLIEIDRITKPEPDIKDDPVKNDDSAVPMYPVKEEESVSK